MAATKTSAKIEEAVKHVTTQHQNASGWISVAHKYNEDKWFQRHYRPEDLPDAVKKFFDEDEHDLYFSQNTMYKPSRKVENIRQLRSLYVDVDYYLFNLDAQWVMGHLQTYLFGQTIPEPNLIIFSGRGIVLVWQIEPVPYAALPLWQAMQNYFAEQLKKLGADTKALDAVRVFRIGGSVNSKSDEVVQVNYLHDYIYDLHDIQREYLPQLQPKQKDGKVKQTKLVRLFNTYSLHAARLKDLVTLCELRQWNMTGYRELSLFLYRYWSCCYLADPVQALDATIELNGQFTLPLPEKEVVRATRSAEKAWDAKNSKEADRIAKDKGYPGAGYNLKNTKIIDWFDITEEEQRHLTTIIGKDEKRRRDREATQKARREAGVKQREEYLALAQERREKAKKMRAEGMSFRAIGRELGCSEGEVRRLLKGA